MAVSEIKAVDRPLDASAPQLSEDELNAINTRIQALDKILAQEKTAKYKIEILFTKARNINGVTPGIIGLWESGSKLHGGGDAKVFICPGKHKGISECEAIIPDVGNGIGFLVCPKCGKAWNGEDVIGELLCKFSMQKWADLVLFYYVKLGHNADIVIKHSRDDIRAAAMVDGRKDSKGGQAEKLIGIREKRVQYIYRLKNIIKDTSAGADLRQRFLAFLTA